MPSPFDVPDAFRQMLPTLSPQDLTKLRQQMTQPEDVQFRAAVEEEFVRRAKEPTRHNA